MLHRITVVAKVITCYIKLPREVTEKSIVTDRLNLDTTSLESLIIFTHCAYAFILTFHLWLSIIHSHTLCLY